MVNANEAKRWRKPEAAGDGVGIESDLHDAIRDECRRRGWVAFSSRMDRRTTRKLGEPDFVIMADQGRTLYVECKSRTGKLSPEQQALHAQARSLGHFVFVVRSFQEFSELITPRERTKD